MSASRSPVRSMTRWTTSGNRSRNSRGISKMVSAAGRSGGVISIADRRGVPFQGGCVAYLDLREFVQKLEKEGELERVRVEVDPLLEITEITQRVARAKNRKPDSGGPGVFFVKPKGSRGALVVDAFGSVRGVEVAVCGDKVE